MNKKELFEIMLDDWIADKGNNIEDLEVKEIYYDDDLQSWAAYAEDGDHGYILSDDGTGNIRISYTATL